MLYSWEMSSAGEKSMTKNMWWIQSGVNRGDVWGTCTKTEKSLKFSPGRGNVNREVDQTWNWSSCWISLFEFSSLFNCVPEYMPFLTTLLTTVVALKLTSDSLSCQSIITHYGFRWFSPFDPKNPFASCCTFLNGLFTFGNDSKNEWQYKINR